MAKTLESEDCKGLTQFTHLQRDIARNASEALDVMRLEAKRMVTTMVEMERSYLTAEVGSLFQVSGTSGRPGSAAADGPEQCLQLDISRGWAWEPQYLQTCCCLDADVREPALWGCMLGCCFAAQHCSAVCAIKASTGLSSCGVQVFKEILQADGREDSLIRTLSGRQVSISCQGSLIMPPVQSASSACMCRLQCSPRSHGICCSHGQARLASSAAWRLLQAMGCIPAVCLAHLQASVTAAGVRVCG